jgi:putative DNA primase/helicase
VSPAIEVGFSDAIVAAGLQPPAIVEADGQLRRFASDGRPGDDSGWYVLHADGVPAGAFGCWRSGVEGKWRSTVERQLSTVEASIDRQRTANAQRERDKQLAERQEEAAAYAQKIWDECEPAEDSHPYLARKNVRAHGARRRNGALVIPIRDGPQLLSLQFIAKDGKQKLFLKRGAVAGGYCSIGKPTDTDTICVAEGFATGATIHETTGHAVVVAFNAGNLEAVARSMRLRFPDAKLIVCADDDRNTPGNPGLTKATEAAIAVGGLLAVPDFGVDRPDGASDFNDLAAQRGAEAVATAIANAPAPDLARPQPGVQNAAEGMRVGREVRLIRGDSIVPEPVRWVWDGWLAAGKFHVLAGQPGTGKTTIALAFAAAVTAGGRWPDRSRATRANVLIWSGEDDPKDTLVPRLRTMGADMSRVYFIGDVHDGIDTRSFDPAQDIAALRHRATSIDNIGLLIVDPIVSAVSGDSHKNAETRRSLQPLVELGAGLGCVVLGISHFTKGTTGREPIERVTGSLAFGALARVVLVAAKLNTEGEGQSPKRMLARAKSNIGPDTGGFGYDLDYQDLPGFEGVSASKVIWGQAIDGTARELLAEAEADVNQDGAQTTPRDFLVALLQHGPMLAKDVFDEANAYGYNQRQMQNAAKSLNVERIKLGMGAGWEWHLSKIPNAPEDTEDTEQNRVAPSVPSEGSSAPVGENAEEF